jgi:hypothetical protein
VEYPLHGSGSDFHKVAPGLTVGFGNAIPRSGKHFPFEFGFYYVGQPGVKIGFTGSACDPADPWAWDVSQWTLMRNSSRA